MRKAMVLMFVMVCLLYSQNFEVRRPFKPTGFAYGIGDVDNDGNLEMVIGGAIVGMNRPWISDPSFMGGFIVIVDSLEKYPNIDNRPHQIIYIDTVPRIYGVLKSVEIGDINNDGSNEIVYHAMMATGTWTDRGIIRVCSWTGDSLIVLNELDGSFRTWGHGLKIADVDQDGRNELVVAQDYYGRKLQVYRNTTGNDLSLIWEDPYSDRCAVDVGDVDGDGAPEIVCATAHWTYYTVRLYKYASGDSFYLAWESPESPGFKDVYLEDITGDGVKDIIASAFNEFTDYGGLFVYSWNGSTYVLLDSIHPNYGLTRCSAGDANGDGIKEIFFFGTPDIGDITEVGYRRFYLWIYGFSGDSLYPQDSILLFIGSHGRAREGLVEIYDFSGNGDIRILSGGCLQDLYLLTWTGTAGIKTLSSVSGVFTSRMFSQGPLKVSYILPCDSHLVIEVYDLLGRKIHELYRGYQAKGEHVIYWDGRDIYGNQVPAGVYYIRINTEEGDEITKVIRIR